MTKHTVLWRHLPFSTAGTSFMLVQYSSLSVPILRTGCCEHIKLNICYLRNKFKLFSCLWTSFNHSDWEDVNYTWKGVFLVYMFWCPQSSYLHSFSFATFFLFLICDNLHQFRFPPRKFKLDHNENLCKWIVNFFAGKQVWTSGIKNTCCSGLKFRISLSLPCYWT